MATLQHNISGNLTTALLSPGDGISSAKSISIANTHATDDVLVDVYIGKLSWKGSAGTSYHLIKGKLISKGESVILDSENIKFNNTSTTGAGLYIKLNNTTSTVDVLIKK